MFVHEGVSLLGRPSLSLWWMEHSLGHSPVCLFKFNMRRVTFLKVPYKSIENLCMSFMLSRVHNALKLITMRLECFLALWSLWDLVPETRGSWGLSSAWPPWPIQEMPARYLGGESSSSSILLCVEERWLLLLPTSMSLSDPDLLLWRSRLWSLPGLLDPEATDWRPEPGLLRSSKWFATLIVNLSEKRNFTQSPIELRRAY